MDNTRQSPTIPQPRLSPPPFSQQQRQFFPDSQSALDPQEVPANYAFTRSDESNNSELNDEFILTALQNPRDRITLLKLEHDLERFINSNETKLSFPPMSSYQRLIVHRVAQYFNLEHTALDIYPQQRTVVLLKTPETKMPPILFREMNVNKEQEAAQPKPAPKAFKIMQRQPAREESASSKTVSKEASTDSSVTKSPEDERARGAKTLEEREQEYAKARARIFSESKTTSEITSQQPADTSSAVETTEERDAQPKNQQQNQPAAKPIQSFQQPTVSQPQIRQQQPQMKPKMKQNKENNTNGVEFRNGGESESRNGWAENGNSRPNTKPFWSSNADNDYNEYSDFYSYDMAPMYTNSGYAYPGDNQEIWPYTEPPYSKSAPQPPAFAQPFPRKSHSFNLGTNSYQPNNVHNYEQPPPPMNPKGGPRQWNNYSREDRVVSPPKGDPHHNKFPVRKSQDVQYMVQPPMGHVSPPPMPNYPSYEQNYHPPPPHPLPYNNDPAWFPPLYNPGYPHRGGGHLPQQQPRQPPMMNNTYPYPSYSHATQLPTGPPSGVPITTYDYERRPPKSTELFDPNAPCEGVTKKMAQMSVSSDRGGGRGGRGGRGGQYYNPNAWSTPQPRDRHG
eukprot:TRINITY_DN4044_c0_g2_i1.p1 TRINITY_DN4044_c0_g2~~TRINITY_DN4044_c0_g2_i1.p1  ORF type:complete len:621 (-),score=98.30 TRINITY_DN4044_c0_g2_i1:995-2857(-)